MSRRKPWYIDDVRALGVVTDLVTAGAILGIGRTTAYALAREDRFPVPVLKVGDRYQVPVAGLMKAIGVDQSKLAS